MADEKTPRFDVEIGALRDQIAEHNFVVARGHDRLLSLVVAKLDEAQGLAILRGKQNGRYVIIDRVEMLRSVESAELNMEIGDHTGGEVTTVTTEENGNADGI